MHKFIFVSKIACFKLIAFFKIQMHISKKHTTYKVPAWSQHMQANANVNLCPHSRKQNISHFCIRSQKNMQFNNICKQCNIPYFHHFLAICNFRKVQPIIFLSKLYWERKREGEVWVLQAWHRQEKDIQDKL